jgi:DNA-binding CsgD family transcriptional regulator
MMLTQIPRTDSFSSSSEKQNTPAEPSDSLLLQGVIESFIDGILILTEQGEWVQANDLACQICAQLTQGEAHSTSVPKEIWCVCSALIESRNSYPNEPLIIESDITTSKSTPLRVRVRWLKLCENPSPCLLVILEDRYQSSQNLAIAEVDKYGLTPREAEVWLLRRADYTCKEIAAKLYISLNTVKKHMKNIHLKREALLS